MTSECPSPTPTRRESRISSTNAETVLSLARPAEDRTTASIVGDGAADRVRVGRAPTVQLNHAFPQVDGSAEPQAPDRQFGTAHRCATLSIAQELVFPAGTEPSIGTCPDSGAHASISASAWSSIHAVSRPTSSRTPRRESSASQADPAAASRRTCSQKFRALSIVDAHNADVGFDAVASSSNRNRRALSVTPVGSPCARHFSSHQNGTERHATYPDPRRSVPAPPCPNR